MSLKVVLTQDEILKFPNDYELGEHVRKKMWEISNNFKYGRGEDKNSEIHSHKKNPWVCTICGKSTEEVEADYLCGYNHLECQINLEQNVEYDNCVLCGKQSPYTRSTHIDLRVGYVEGCGQGCFQPYKCDRV